MEPNWWIEPWRKYSDFSGRARRKEYWIFTLEICLIFFVIYFFLGLLAGFGNSSYDTNNSNIFGIGGAIVVIVLFIAIIIPSWAVSIRRLHDTDKSGWWMLLNFVPYVGSFIILFFTLLDSTPGDNKYGPNPKGIKAVLYSTIDTSAQIRNEVPNIADELQKLAQLRDQGIISQDDFEMRKTKLLG